MLYRYTVALGSCLLFHLHHKEEIFIINVYKGNQTQDFVKLAWISFTSLPALAFTKK